MPRDRYHKQSLGTVYTRIRESRVLMVGAGGIGCELLKNLLLTGFGEVHIVDLDTIDLSNLNRQFLFGHEHIKRSKALVAKESAQKFNPSVKIEAHHANIKDPQFNVGWFASFNLVFNALDNLDARRYVNKMCLAADVPLIESGTTGYNGQVQVIRRARTECYDCNPKDAPKTFPVCTIRSTPSQPIHCIVWAKSYLFAEIFGTSEDDSPELDTTEDSANAPEIAKLRAEAQALQRIRASMGSADFPRAVFDKVFTADIERLRSMHDMWKLRRPPVPLSFDDLASAATSVSPDISHRDQRAWSAPESFAVFLASLTALSARLDELKASQAPGNSAPVLSFDKDDKPALDFVTAAANLRSTIFEIPIVSEFETKRMAGNIIPAIATTNAMAAALCVLQALKVLRDDYAKARMVFLTPSADRVISSEPLRPPRPDCAVCGVARASVAVDLERATLRDVVEGLLQTQLGYGEEVSVVNDAGGLLYDAEETENLGKILKDLGVEDGSFLTVVDEDDEQEAGMRVNLALAISEQTLVGDGYEAVERDASAATAAVEVSGDGTKKAEDHALSANPAVVLREKIEIKRKPKPVACMNGHTTHPASNGDVVAATAGVKRKRPAEDHDDEGNTGADLEAQIVKKRGKVAEEDAPSDVPPVTTATNGHVDGAGAVVLDDGGDTDGAIFIDDDD